MDVAFIFGPPPVDGLETLTLISEHRLVAMRPEHPFAEREFLTGEDIRSLPWLRVPAPRGPWPDFWFRSSEPGPVGPLIRTADEWVTAIEAGRGFAFTMPSVMENFRTARVRVVPAADLAEATVLMAWRRRNNDPLLEAFVRAAKGVMHPAAEAVPEG